MRHTSHMMGAMCQELLELSMSKLARDWVAKAQERGITPTQIQSELAQRGMRGQDVAQAASFGGMTPTRIAQMRQSMQGYQDPLQTRSAMLQQKPGLLPGRSPQSALGQAMEARGVVPSHSMMQADRVNAMHDVVRSTAPAVALAGPSNPHQVHAVQPTPPRELPRFDPVHMAPPPPMRPPPSGLPRFKLDAEPVAAKVVPAAPAPQPSVQAPQAVANKLPGNAKTVAAQTPRVKLGPNMTIAQRIRNAPIGGTGSGRAMRAFDKLVSRMH